MIAQLILSALLLVMIAYAFVAARRTPLLGPAIGVAALVGLVFVWWPQGTNDVAHAVGIGRGADLILYLWVILSMLVSLNLHLRVKTQAGQITELARAIALLEARQDSQGENTRVPAGRSH